MYIYLWLHLSTKRNYKSFVETTSLLHISQNVFSLWFGIIHKACIWKNSFFLNTEMKEPSIKEPTERLGNIVSQTSRL